MKYVLLFLVVYLIGGIPFAYIIGKLTLHEDIRRIGSKNPGAGNVFLLVGWKAGTIALIGDIGKGAFAMYIADSVFGVSYPAILLFLVATVLGHIFSPFLLFRGGKGVAVAAGSYSYIICSLFGFANLVAVLVFITIPGVIIYKLSGSLVVSLSLTPLFFLVAQRLFAYDSKLFIFSVFLTLFIELWAFPRIKREWTNYLKHGLSQTAVKRDKGVDL
jgi:glycerol-3-phosphate acyltransferase PlsY